MGKSWLPAASLDQVLASSRLTLIIEEHVGEPSKQRSRNWLFFPHRTNTTAFTKQLGSYNEVAQPGPAYMAAGQQVRRTLRARSHMTMHDVTAITTTQLKTKNGHYDDGYAMKRINRKTVETRLSFAAAFSSPHPFVAFVLSESLGTRLVSGQL